MASVKPIPVVPARVILVTALLDTGFSVYVRDWFLSVVFALCALVALAMAERF